MGNVYTKKFKHLSPGDRMFNAHDGCVVTITGPAQLASGFRMGFPIEVVPGKKRIMVGAANAEVLCVGVSNG